MKVKITKLSLNAVIPAYAHTSDAGLDLVATDKSYDDYGNVVYHTGIAMEIPEGYVGLLFPRSSNAKKDLWLTNSVGVIDSGYRGEILFKFRKSSIESPKEYEIGDRVGQIIIMPYPKIEFVEVAELSDSDRGVCGYGSTGE